VDSNKSKNSCNVCNKEISIISGFVCSYCKVLVCDDHRIPENHNCCNLDHVNKIQDIQHEYHIRPEKIESEYKGISYLKSNKKSYRKNEKIKIIFGVLFAIFVIGGVWAFSSDVYYIELVNEKISNDVLPIINSAVDSVNEKIPDNIIIPIKNNIDDIIDDVKITPKENKLVEYYIWKYTNDEREKQGLKPLQRISKINSIAYNHSLDMSNRNYFDHITPEGLDPTDRGNNAGYNCRKDFGSYYTVGLAENIQQQKTYSSITYVNSNPINHWYETPQSLSKEIVNAWMNSEGHRENILDESYDKIGIGVVIDSNDDVYSTQNFC